MPFSLLLMYSRQTFMADKINPWSVFYFWWATSAQNCCNNEAVQSHSDIYCYNNYSPHTTLLTSTETLHFSAICCFTSRLLKLTLRLSPSSSHSIWKISSFLISTTFCLAKVYVYVNLLRIRKFNPKKTPCKFMAVDLMPMGFQTKLKALTHKTLYFKEYTQGKHSLKWNQFFSFLWFRST